MVVSQKADGVTSMIAMTDPRHAPWWEKREEYIRKITWPIATTELTREQFPWNLDDDALHWIPRIAVVLRTNNKDLLDWMWEDAQMDSEKAVDELHQLVDYFAEAIVKYDVTYKNMLKFIKKIKKEDSIEILARTLGFMYFDLTRVILREANLKLKYEKDAPFVFENKIIDSIASRIYIGNLTRDRLHRHLQNEFGWFNIIKMAKRSKMEYKFFLDFLWSNASAMAVRKKKKSPEKSPKKNEIIDSIASAINIRNLTRDRLHQYLNNNFDWFNIIEMAKQSKMEYKFFLDFLWSNASAMAVKKKQKSLEKSPKRKSKT